MTQPRPHSNPNPSAPDEATVLVAPPLAPPVAPSAFRPEPETAAEQRRRFLRGKDAWRPPVDDRGRAIKPVQPQRITRVGDRDADRIDRDARKVLKKTIVEAIRGEQRKIDPVNIAVGLAVVSVWIVLQILAISYLRRFGVGLAVVSMAAAVAVITALSARKVGQRIVNTYVSNGFCAQCGYVLQGLTPEHDRCVVCPECAAAWKISRITWPVWKHGALAPPPKQGLLWAFLFGGTRRRDRWTADDRGALRCCVDPRFGAWRGVTVGRVAQSGPGLAPPDNWRKRRRALTREIRKSGRIKRWLLAGLVMLPGLGAISIAWAAAREPRPDWVVLSVMGVLTVIFVGGVLAVIFSSTGVNFRRAATIIVSEGICPCCAFSLDAAPLDEEQFRVCPGCGGSWVCNPGEPGLASARA